MEIITMLSEYVMGALNIALSALMLVIIALLGVCLCIIFGAWIIEIISAIQEMLDKDGEDE